MNNTILNTLNRHQIVWVYLTFTAAVSGFSAGKIVPSSTTLAILTVFNGILVIYLCSRIENKTVNRDYVHITKKMLSPLQSYIYLKAERYWIGVSIILIATGFLTATYIAQFAISIPITAVAWGVLSAIMWKLYKDTVYNEIATV